jgi:phosphatidate cytidylyltransferase
VSGDDAAPAGSAPGSSNLVMRVVAALVLAPLALVLAYAGGWLWALLVTLASIGLFVEWLIVVGAGQAALSATGTVALAIVGFAAAFGSLNVAVVVGVLGLAAIAFMARGQRVWASAGFLYAAAALLTSVLLRQDPVNGFAALLFVLFVVWASDIGGYFAGRAIGGPKLWPRVSPKKTWAGAIGGFVASLVIAAGFAALGYGKALPLLVLAAGLSIAAQFGDLFESAVKRHFGVKDSSHIIPGHGGLMDRLDGFVAAIVLAAIFGSLRGGVDGVGRALMVW